VHVAATPRTPAARPARHIARRPLTPSFPRRHLHLCHRKRALLLHLAATRQRLQRLDVLLQWCHKATAVAECKRVLEVAAQHSDALRHSADQLAYLHGEILDMAAPPYDVPTALHVLQTGGRRQLPTVIEEELEAKPEEGGTGGAAKAEALARMDFLLRCKLLGEPLPAGLAVLAVGGGEAILGSTSGQYTARLTLVPSPPDEVTVTKWTPAAASGGAPAAAAEAEVTQSAPAGADTREAPAAAGEGAMNASPMDLDGAAAAAAGDGGGGAASEGVAPGEVGHWRWRLLSLELLPRQPRPVAPALLARWLQRNVEDRMWAAGDVQQLRQLGQEHLVAVPPPPVTQRQRQQRQQDLDAAGRGDAAAARGGSGPAVSSAAGLPSGSQLGAVSAGGAGAVAPAAAGEQLPGWVHSPLAAMHSVLTQASSRLALSSLIVEGARALEQGAWAGHLRVERAPEGPGCRLSFWTHLPALSYDELQAVRSGVLPGRQPVGGQSLDAAAPAAPAAPAVDVVIAADGGLRCAPVAPLLDPGSGRSVELSVLDPDGVIAAERLLLSAAARCAAIQLSGVQAALRRDDRVAAALGDGCAFELHDDPSSLSTPRAAPRPPALLVHSQGETLLSVTLDLRSGRPSLALGPGLLEDAELAGAAERLAAPAPARLDQAVQAARRDALPPGHTRATVLVSSIAKVAAELLVQLAGERQMAELATAAAAAAHLRRAPLPRCVADGVSGAAAALALAVPPFPPPRQLQAFEAVGVGQRGSLRCFLLADLGTREASGGPALSLAVCCATSRGVVTSLRALLPVPSILATLGGRAAPVASDVAPATGHRGKRKRTMDDDGAAAGSAAGSAKVEVAWRKLAEWCLRAAAQQQLEAQLEAVQLQYEVEVRLPSASTAAAHQLLRLPPPPALAALDRELSPSANGDAGGGRPVDASPGGGIVLQLDPGSDAARGAWTTRISSCALAALPERYATQGLPGAALEDACLSVGADGSLEFRHELAAGEPQPLFCQRHC